MSEITLPKPYGKSFPFIPFFGPKQPEIALNLNDLPAILAKHWIVAPSKTTQTGIILSKIKSKLANQPKIESVWLEDLGKKINVLINTEDVRNTTLHPIFDAQYALESEFKNLSFHFEINPLDLEEKQKYNQVIRLI